MIKWSIFVFFLLGLGMFLKLSTDESSYIHFIDIKRIVTIEDQSKLKIQLGNMEYTFPGSNFFVQTMYKIVRTHKLHFIILPFVVLMVLLERLIPLKKTPLFREGFFSDLGWYSIGQEQLLSICLTGYLRQFSFSHQFRMISDQPIWVQVVIVFLIFDFVSYWFHRYFHSSIFWRFHELHHSSTQIDWLSGLRQHPMDLIFAAVVNAIIYCLTGADFKVSLIVASILTIHGIYKHSNIRNNIGWLQYIIISSDMHRLHHLSEVKYQQSNYGTVLSIWDIMFGSVCYPKGNEQNQIPFGTDSEYPQDFIRGNIYVFRKMK